MRDAVDVLVVAGEPPWPAVNGGRRRTGSIAAALASSYSVVVVAPPDASDLDFSASSGPVPVIELPRRERPNLGHFLSRAPRLGRAQISREALRALDECVGRLRPKVVLYAMSYLAALRPRYSETVSVVDFANVELHRLRSLASSGAPRQRAATAVEAAKAQLWEPRVARQADLAIAVDAHDAQQLERWCASPVVVANTATRPPSYAPSSSEPLGVFVTSGSYRPNAEAGRWLVAEVWPRVRRAVPAARLRIVGHRSDHVFAWAHGRDGVEVAGSVSDIGEELSRAAVVLAPTATGGGTQLKIIEALAAGRAVVARGYGARSVPPSAAGAVVLADDAVAYASAVEAVLRDLPMRHAMEARAWSADIPTWADAVEPLIDRLLPSIARQASAVGAAA